MPLTTYVAGDVLTASSLNANFTFAATNPPGGLELISTTTIGSAVSTVTVTSAFSATYENYKIIISGGTATGGATLRMQLGATSSGYYGVRYQGSWASAFTTFGTNNASLPADMGSAETSGLNSHIDVFQPFAATRTFFTGSWIGLATATGNVFSQTGSFVNNTTSYTAFTITPNSGTITGGTIRVYGYKD